MLSRSRAAFDELREGVKDIEFLTDPTTGEVKIGSTEPIGSNFVSTVIERLHRRYPRIVIHFRIKDDYESLQGDLNERNIDLLFVRKFGPFAEDQLNFKVLYYNPYVVAAGVTNPLVQRRRVKLVELVDELWVLPPPDSRFGLLAAEAFRASGLDRPRAAVVAYAHEVRISLLRMGHYLTLFPESVLMFPAKHPFIKKVTSVPTSLGEASVIG
jgi:DNA-binding transcriptional LysR family regulator